MNDGNVPPRRRGCLFYGVLSALVLSLLVAVLGYMTYRYARNAVTQLVNNYTDTAPMPLEQVEMPPEELQALRQRIVAFQEARNKQNTAQELALTARDINALIAHDPEFKDFKDRLFVMIESNQIKGRVSIPLEDFGPLKLKGRYLNGTAAFKVALEAGDLQVNIDNVDVNGRPLPAPLLAELQKENLARNLENNPEAMKEIQKFDRIQVRDGRLILLNKAKE